MTGRHSMMLKIIQGGDPDPDATQPCEIVPARTIRDLDEYRRAQRDEMRAEVAPEVYQQAMDHMATGLSPQFVAAVRGDATELTVTIGDTDVLVTFGARPAATMSPDQIKAIWAATVAVFTDIRKLPYLKTHFALPKVIRSLEWATKDGPVIVAHTEAFRKRRGYLPKFLSGGRGPVSLLPIVGIGAPKITAIVTACVGVCVVAQMAIPGGPVTPHAHGTQTHVVMEEAYVPPPRLPSGVISPTPSSAAPTMTATPSASPTPAPDSPAYSHPAAPAPQPEASATPTQQPATVTPPTVPEVTPPPVADSTPPTVQDVAPSVDPSVVGAGMASVGA